MLVVASTTNISDGVDLGLMMGHDRVGRSANWFPIFKRNCKEVVVTGEFWHSLVSIRGSLSDDRNMASIWVCGTRCPIHSVDQVCKLGNKTIVDLVVAIDPTGIRRKKAGWTFEVDFPQGFTPMCYTSNKSSLQHLAVLFRRLGVMAVDVTPVSFTLIWDIAERCSVELDNSIIANGQYHKLEVLNATPEVTYQVKVLSEESIKYATVAVETPPMNPDSMSKFYSSRASLQDVFDLDGVKDETVAYLRKEGILKSGQSVKLSTDVGVAVVVLSGDTTPLSDGKNIYVVPDFSVDIPQFVCLEDDSQTNHVVEFDKSESYVKYRDRVYPHGSSFSVMNTNSTMRTINVVKGSIILVVDNPVQYFPEDAALQVKTSGDLVVRDLVMRCSSQVTEKVDGETTYGRNSFSVYDPANGTTKECTRVSHGLNDAGDSGSLSIDLLYTDGNSTESMVNTISSDPTKTCISTRDKSSPEVITATFNSSGLSFDSDNGNIYFGADKDFRIHYAEAAGLDPAMLQIQSLSDAGEYLTRFLITAEPP